MSLPVVIVGIQDKFQDKSIQVDIVNISDTLNTLNGHSQANKNGFSARPRAYSIPTNTSNTIVSECQTSCQSESCMQSNTLSR